MRRVRPADVTQDADGNHRPISSVFRQGGPQGDVSVYLTNETTAEVITRNHPGTLLVELTIAEIRAQGLDVQRENIPGDPGHCNIIGRKTRSIAKTFAEICRWPPGFGPP